MTVSIESTSRKYRGRKAETYDEIRQKQQRWREENAAVEQMVRDLPRGTRLLDAPMGTGRFVDLWKKRGFDYVGVDTSDEMISLAVEKGWPPKRARCMSVLDVPGPTFDAAVSVRFFDLIDEKALYEVLRKLDAITKRRIVCTIRFGERYAPKPNTAEHDEKKFSAFARRAGWTETRRVPIFRAGWHVLQLDR